MSALEFTPLLANPSHSSSIGAHKSTSDNHKADGAATDEVVVVEDVDTPHTIGSFGSVALIMNNLTGPAMLGFPHLFQQAGILPVVIGITFVYVASSLCGTFLSDSIASIPGNNQFKKRVDFSTAFRLTVGEGWYAVAETLFLISCAVQACAAIVESAQSVDGFLASFVLGKTYALQLFPTVEFISWSAESCHAGSINQAESDLSECTPFSGAGPMIFTLGFAVTTAIFLPLGQGHLKETIALQIFSFIFMIVLLAQFSFEFLNRGLSFQLPWVGNDITQLAGVVLFNYAFSITVPAWLVEKHPDVSVNHTIWISTTAASVTYALFGILGAMSFEDVSPNMLVLLTSSKVHSFTRFSAALFGLIIIGCGVPVFCVIIRNALEFNHICSPAWASVWGSYMPFLISWMLYQGSVLMSVLNWTGLIVNGLVAFLLPMILALKSTELRSQNRRAQGVTLLIDAQPEILITRETPRRLVALSFDETSYRYGSQSEPSIELMTGMRSRTHSHSSDPTGGNRRVTNGDISVSPFKKTGSQNEEADGYTSLSTLHPQSSQFSDKSTHDSSKSNGHSSNGNGQSHSRQIAEAEEGERDEETMSLNQFTNRGRSLSTASEGGTTMLDQDRQELLRSRLQETRVVSNTTVQPLPVEFEVYRREIVLFMIMSFAMIILMTIMEDALQGITP